MSITTLFRVTSLAHENSVEMEYFHDDGIYQIRILQMKKNHNWEVKAAIELQEIEASQLLEFLRLTREK